MSKVLFAISLMALVACGTGESDSDATGSAADTPAVSAAGSAGDEVEVVVEEVEVIQGEQADAEMDAAEISSCISLVASGKYEDALPVCLEAASIDADNEDVKAALAKAETETAKEAATGAAADALGGLGN